MSQNFYNLFIPIKKLDEIFDEAFIVIDTNVLLMAYQWRDITFNAVFDVLCELSNQGRLKIPNQVIKEFAKNRPEVIQGLYQDIKDKLLSTLKSEKINADYSIDKVVPAFDMISASLVEPIKKTEEKYIESIQNLNQSKNEYKKALQQLQTIVKSLMDFDPISHQFKEIFENSYMDELVLDEEELKEELKRRKDNLIPPGYKDKGHKGDYLIWESILSLKDKPVIFVTGDNKADWAYTIGKDFIGARRELVEEFHEKNQQTIKILTPLQFIEEYSKRNGKPVEDEVKEDLGKDNLEAEHILPKNYFILPTDNISYLNKLPLSKYWNNNTRTSRLRKVNTWENTNKKDDNNINDTFSQALKEQCEILLMKNKIGRDEFDRIVDEIAEVYNLYENDSLSKDELFLKYQAILQIIFMYEIDKD